jgi:hypothetical protein
MLILADTPKLPQLIKYTALNTKYKNTLTYLKLPNHEFFTKPSSTQWHSIYPNLTCAYDGFDQ